MWFERKEHLWPKQAVNLKRKVNTRVFWFRPTKNLQWFLGPWFFFHQKLLTLPPALSTLPSCFGSCFNSLPGCLCIEPLNEPVSRDAANESCQTLYFISVSTQFLSQLRAARCWLIPASVLLIVIPVLWSLDRLTHMQAQQNETG